MWGVVYYELLKSPETISNHYRLQPMRLKQAIQERRPEWHDKHEKLIFQHDDGRPHVGQPIRTYLEGVKWKGLPHTPYSPYTAPSDYHLFRSMQSALTEERFTLHNSIQKLVDDWVASKEIEFFTRGIRFCSKDGQRLSL
ncbi:hypothetical protein Trydic_g11741 [Trypoxylus dichotomus]